MVVSVVCHHHSLYFTEPFSQVVFQYMPRYWCCICLCSNKVHVKSFILLAPDFVDWRQWTCPGHLNSWVHTKDPKFNVQRISYDFVVSVYCRCWCWPYRMSLLPWTRLLRIKISTRITAKSSESLSPIASKRSQKKGEISQIVMVFLVIHKPVG